MADIEFTDNSRRALSELNEVVDRILEAWGITGERNAKLELENNPRRVDTGLLRNSVTYALSGGSPNITTYQSNSADKNGNPVDIKSGSYSGTAPIQGKGSKAVFIGTNVEYAEYVHEGTKGGKTKKGTPIPPMAPNRFIKNGIANHKEDFKTIMKNELEG